MGDVKTETERDRRRTRRIVHRMANAQADLTRALRDATAATQGFALAILAARTRSRSSTTA